MLSFVCLTCSFLKLCSSLLFVLDLIFLQLLGDDQFSFFQDFLGHAKLLTYSLMCLNTAPEPCSHFSSSMKTSPAVKNQTCAISRIKKKLFYFITEWNLAPLPPRVPELLLPGPLKTCGAPSAIWLLNELAELTLLAETKTMVRRRLFLTFRSHPSWLFHHPLGSFSSSSSSDKCVKTLPTHFYFPAGNWKQSEGNPQWGSADRLPNFSF